jgi:hypothetical protein
VRVSSAIRRTEREHLRGLHAHAAHRRGSYTTRGRGGPTSRLQVVWRVNSIGRSGASRLVSCNEALDPQLPLAETAWASAMQRKEPVASTRFLAAQLHDLWNWSGAGRVRRQPTLTGSTAGCNSQQ